MEDTTTQMQPSSAVNSSTAGKELSTNRMHGRWKRNGERNGKRSGERNGGNDRCGNKGTSSWFAKGTRREKFVSFTENTGTVLGVGVTSGTIFGTVCNAYKEFTEGRIVGVVIAAAICVCIVTAVVVVLAMLSAYGQQVERKDEADGRCAKDLNAPSAEAFDCEFLPQPQKPNCLAA